MSLVDAKILITGPAGQIAFPIARRLAADNEVWGIARFGEEESRRRVEALGVTTRRIDLGTGEFGDLPGDFTHVLHLAVAQGPGRDTDHGLRVNAEGTGLLMQHCASARFLVMSTFSVYEPQPDRWYPFAETDQMGDTRQPYSPTYSVSKIGQEAVARTTARLFAIPTVIARMNVAYGTNGGLPALHLDALRRGDPIVLRDPGPTPYSPIHEDDIVAQVGPLLEAASVPATVVNWAGDDVVTAEQWVAELEQLTGLTADIRRVATPNSVAGSVSDNTRRLAITGPCEVSWPDGLARMVAERA
ncbi:MAG: NAD-dependent epimerase/dehydratase family protein [Acidimicrobiales bacterium]